MYDMKQYSYIVISYFPIIFVCFFGLYTLTCKKNWNENTSYLHFYLEKKLYMFTAPCTTQAKQDNYYYTCNINESTRVSVRLSAVDNSATSMLLR